MLRLVPQFIAKRTACFELVLVQDAFTQAVTRFSLDDVHVDVPLLEQVGVEKERRFRAQGKCYGIGGAGINAHFLALYSQPQSGDEDVVAYVCDGGFYDDCATQSEDAVEKIVRGGAVATRVVGEGGTNGIGLRGGDGHFKGVLAAVYGLKGKQAAVVS